MLHESAGIGACLKNGAQLKVKKLVLNKDSLYTVKIVLRKWSTRSDRQREGKSGHDIKQILLCPRLVALPGPINIISLF